MLLLLLLLLISCAVRWMPDKKGLVTGIIVAGFGCGAFVFGQFAIFLVNPHKDSVLHDGPDEGYFAPDSYVIERVPYMFTMLSIVYFVLMTVGSVLLFEPPFDNNNNNNNNNSISQQFIKKNEKILKTVKFSHQYQSTNTTEADFDIMDSENNNKNKSSIIEMKTFNDEDHVNKSITTTVVPNNDNNNNNIDNNNNNKDIGPREIIELIIFWHLASCFIMTTVG